MSTQRATSPPVPVELPDDNKPALPTDNAYIARAADRTVPGRVGIIGNADGRLLTERLSEAFQLQPVVDGEEHPADVIIAAFLASDSGKPHPCALETIILGSEDTDLVAATLQCTARFEPPWSDERKANLVRNALRDTDICVRDAAVRAAESWLCPDVVTELEAHRDSESWLQEHIVALFGDQACLFSPSSI